MSKTKSNDKNGDIRSEYYPLLTPNDDTFNPPVHYSNIYSTDVVAADRDGTAAFLVTLASMVILALTGLVFCKFWGLARESPLVILAQMVWLSSPLISALAMRKSKIVRIMFSWPSRSFTAFLLQCSAEMEHSTHCCDF